MTEADPKAIRPEDHTRLAVAIALRVLWRPTEDDIGTAILALVEAARLWNAGKRPCRWSTFASNRIRWELLYRFRLASAAAIAAEVPLYLSSADDEEAEIERPEMGVEDPGPREAEARLDVERLLATLPPTEAFVIRRRFGIGVPKETGAAVGEALGLGKQRIAQIEAKALASLRERATGGGYACLTPGI